MPHAIMIPLPFQGHITPFANLAVRLASAGFTITFVTTESTHHQIRRPKTQASPSPEEKGVDDDDDDVFSEVNKTGLNIRHLTVSDGLPIEFDRNSNSHSERYLRSLYDVFPSKVNEIVGDLARSDSTVKCLIADSYYAWPSTICRKHNLVLVSFWTEPALVLNIYYHLHLLRQNGHFGSTNNRKDLIDYLPGVDSIKQTDLPSFLQDTDTSTILHQVVFAGVGDMKNADIIICNTIQELEDKTLLALNQKASVYAIGPIIPSNLTQNPVPISFWPESDITQWLDSKSRASVLYVSFGSLCYMTRNDIIEIACGLLLSEFHFVWVLRPGIVSSNESSDLLPSGFQDLIKNRGLILPWCCQITTLSHSAIGGFLTHCGWNSILESISCGVPMICFPLETDQITNRKLVVDDWRIGMNLRTDGEVIERGLVAQRINQLMGDGEVRQDLTKEIDGVKKKLEDVMAVNGSSQKNFEQFIVDLKGKILET